VNAVAPPTPGTSSHPEGRLPRLVIGGLGGDTGKSLVTLGLIGAMRRRGLRVAAFKKGPDFIDAAWLGLAAGSPARNLDSWLMPENVILQTLRRAEADIAVIEGNRGLFDGVDAWGSHSTARLATRIAAPVILVIDASRVTATVAAFVLGCRAMDASLRLEGVILNRVATGRHEQVIRDAVAHHAGVPVLGAVPRVGETNLPGRHMGLVTPSEAADAQATIDGLATLVDTCVQVDALLALARSAPALLVPEPPIDGVVRPVTVRVGILQDRAFSFYYPENLEALQAAGAEIVPISPLLDREVPDVDALVAGGGFPEEHAAGLAANALFRDSLARRIRGGLPVWAECGGLGYLSREIRRDDASFPMVGVLPVTVVHTAKPQGHGYLRATVEGANPFFDVGSEIVGHEFHYGRVLDCDPELPSILRLLRGHGLGNGRDGLCFGSVVATWAHLHALATPDWAPAIVRAATAYRAARTFH
jgi:cobyrinic acid a,c-diamide synthase